jgi:DNA-binding transcriptional ArsR family regulator
MIDLFGDTARTRIWNFLLLYAMSSEYSKSEIARNSYVSWRSFNRVWPEIAKLGILNERRVGQSRLYRLNTDNSVAQLLVRLADETAFQSLASSMPLNERAALRSIPQLVEAQVPITNANSGMKFQFDAPLEEFPTLTDLWRTSI